MGHREKIAYISGYLRALEEINMDSRFQLYYRFQEVEKGHDIYESMAHVYRQHVEKIHCLGDELDILKEVLSAWFIHPVNPPINRNEEMEDGRVSAFLALLENVLGNEPFLLYELQLPPSLFGAFAEHFVIEQTEHLYLLNFNWL